MNTRPVGHGFPVQLTFALLLMMLPLVSHAQDDEIIRWRDRQNMAHVKDRVIRRDLESLYEDPSEFYPSLYQKPKLKQEPPRIFPVTLQLRVIDYSCCSVSAESKDLSIWMTEREFDPANHSLVWDTLHGATRPEIYRIDGHPFFGTDGDLPRYCFESIVVTVAGNSVLIPKGAYSDLYEPNFQTLQAYQTTDGSRLYITMMNSDGAGGYGVTWCFRKGKYVRLIVEYGW